MGQPLYEGVAAKLRDQIDTLGPGQALPSESKLSTEHKVSRNTIRQALELLEREGLVLGKQGRGWFVRSASPLRWHVSRSERNQRTDVSPADVWADDVRDQGRKPEESIEVTIRAAGSRVGALLDLPPEALVVARRRTRYVDGDIYMVDVSFYERDLVRGTSVEEPDDVLPGVWQVMEQMGHGWIDPPRDEYYARSATAAEADVFGIVVGAPVLERWRIRRTTTGTPVAVTHTIGPGERLIVVTGDEGEP